MTLGAEGESFDHVTYLGHTIPLSRTYSDFHDYRDDPDNLPKAVLPLVQSLVKTAPVPSSFPTRKAAADALYELMFPGYGYSMLGLGDPIALFSLEIPGSGQERFLLFAPFDGTWNLVDDFVWAESAGYINHAAIKGDVISYYDRHSSALRETRMAPNNRWRGP